MSVIFSVIVKSIKIIVVAVRKVFKRSHGEIQSDGKKQASGCGKEAAMLLAHLEHP